MLLWPSVILCLSLGPGFAWAGDAAIFPDLNVNDPAALEEASRVLEEEIRLATKPQTYAVVDLAAGIVDIKGRGLTLHRLPIERWTAAGTDGLTSTFRLTARPPVVRRKIDPAAAGEQEPISLADMPVQYALVFAPPFTLEVVPQPSDRPLLRSWAAGRMYWRRLEDWGRSWFSSQAAQSRAPLLQLTLPEEHARSLAWALVDGMAVIIRRPSTN